MAKAKPKTFNVGETLLTSQDVYVFGIGDSRVEAGGLSRINCAPLRKYDRFDESTVQVQKDPTTSNDA